MLQNLSKLFLVGFLIGSLLMILHRGCRHESPNKPKTIVENPNGSKVIVRHTNDKQRTDTTPYIPPEGKVIITPKDPTKSINDVIKIHYQRYGFTFEPGIQTVLFAEPNLGFDVKVIYARRFGLNVGFVAGRNLSVLVSPTVSMSYRLDQIHLPNTEAFIGYVPLDKFTIQTGFRINL